MHHGQLQLRQEEYAGGGDATVGRMVTADTGERVSEDSKPVPAGP